VNEWRVTFERPVFYLSESKLRRKEITELLVNAPTAEGAGVHAIRVTTGDPGAITVEPVDIWRLSWDTILMRRGLEGFGPAPPAPGRVEPPTDPVTDAPILKP
jgi:hypothetical protein